MTLFDDLLHWVVPDREKCRAAAAELAAEHPNLSPEQLVREAVRSAKRWAAAAGGATGAAANPLIMIPAAMADMAAVLRIEGAMAGTIAALLDPASMLIDETFQADVISIVFPGAVSQALRQLGVRAGQRLTKTLIEKYLTESFLRSAVRIASKYLFVRVTEKAVVSKTVPVVGAGIGAAWNWLELQAVGNRGIRYYQRRAIGPRRGRVPVASRVRS